MQVYLFRHGQTPGNAAHRYLGITDEPLSELGVETAQKTGCDPTVSEVLVSPLQRTQMTAAILFPNARQRVCYGFREMDFGDFEGRSAQEMENDAKTTSTFNSPQGSSAALGLAYMVISLPSTMIELSVASTVCLPSPNLPAKPPCAVSYFKR